MKKMTKNELGRRNFFTRASKYLLGMGIFGVASIFGLRREGDLRVGKVRKTEFKMSEALGACSYGSDCAGGGGTCSYGSSCGGGGGTCSYGSNCAGGGGRCSYGSSCGGS